MTTLTHLRQLLADTKLRNEERLKSALRPLRVSLSMAETEALLRVAEAASQVLKARVAPRGLAGFQVLPLPMHHLRKALAALDKAGETT